MSGHDLGRDLDPPVPVGAPAAVPDGLVLGIDVEELYFDVGEGFRLWFTTVLTGTEDRPPPNEGKAARVRAALWKLPGAADLVERFDDLRDRSLRIERPEAYGDGASGEHELLENDYDQFMRDLRQTLTGPTATWFDVGVFLARFHLCAAVVERPPDRLGADWEGIYRRELTRVAPSLRIVATMAATTAPWVAAPIGLRRGIDALRAHIERWDGGTAGWAGAAREYADAVFGSLGMTYSGGSPLLVLNDHLTAREQPDEAPPVADDPADAALAEARRLWDTAGTDPASAEAGLRALLQATRRRLGPHHPVVYMIQTGLVLVLHVSGLTGLAVDLALDTADEAGEHLGLRHPVSALAAVHAVRILRAVGRTGEADALAEARTGWLLLADPAELAPELAAVRETIIGPEETS